jgi:hypothetical protein
MDCLSVAKVPLCRAAGYFIILYCLFPGFRRPAYRTPLHPEGSFKTAFMKKAFILKELHGRPVPCYTALMKDNGAFAQIHGHIQVMGSDDLCMMEGL